MKRWCSVCGKHVMEHRRNPVCRTGRLVGKQKGYKIRRRLWKLEGKA